MSVTAVLSCTARAVVWRMIAVTSVAARDVFAVASRSNIQPINVPRPGRTVPPEAMQQVYVAGPAGCAKQTEGGWNDFVPGARRHCL